MKGESAMSKLRIEYVKAAWLRENATQPQTRYGDASYKRLLEDIREHGIQKPLDVTRDGVILCGHRRWKCAQELGIEEVPVQFQEASDWMVREAKTQRRWAGTEYLYNYLHGGELPADMTAGRQVLYIEELCGRSMLTRMAKINMSPSVWGTATLIWRYCAIAKDDLAFRQRTIQYLVDGRRQAVIKSAIKANIPPRTLKAAIDESRDLRMEWA